MPAAAVGLVGAGISYMNAKDAQSAAEEQFNQEKALRERSLGLSERQARMSEERLAREEKMFAPIKERLIREGMSETPAGWDTTSNMIRGEYGRAARRASAMPSAISGLAAATVAGQGIHAASDLASAFTQAKEKQRASLMSLMGLDKSTQMSGEAERGRAQQLAQMGSLAASYGSWAGSMGQSAQQGYGTAFKGLGQGIAQAEDWFGKRGKDEAGEDVDMASTSTQSVMEPQSALEPSSKYGNMGDLSPSLKPVFSDAEYDSSRLSPYFGGDYTIRED